MDIHLTALRNLVALFVMTCAAPCWAQDRTPLHLPDATLPTLDGSETSLSATSGKVVLVNLWATWCAPCVAEMPALERLYQKFKDKGLVVLAVSGDDKDNIEGVKAFADRYGLTFPILLDPDKSMAKTMGAEGFPETFFYSKSGELLRLNDPATGKEKSKVISDRPWDAPKFIEAVEALLKRQDTSGSAK